MLTEVSFIGSAPFPAGDQFTQSFTPAFTPEPFDDETVHYSPSDPTSAKRSHPPAGRYQVFPQAGRIAARDAYRWRLVLVPTAAHFVCLSSLVADRLALGQSEQLQRKCVIVGTFP